MEQEFITAGRIAGAHGVKGEVALLPLGIDAERAKEWIKTGAQPTDTVRALLKKVDVL